MMWRFERHPGIRPRPSPWRRLDAMARAAFPATSTALLMLLAAAPLGIDGQAQLQAGLALCGVFFWSLFRPASMSPPVVFLIGLLQELLGMAPLGSAVLVLLMAHGVALAWRRFLVRQGFLLVWLVFVSVAAAAAALTWMIAAALSFRLLPVLPVLFQFALAAGMYPALAVLFIRAHRGPAAPEQA